MALKSFMPMFTGEVPYFELYRFTPDAEHDPTQKDRPLPRVLWVLDDFPVNDGQTILIVRCPEVADDNGVAYWDNLPDPVLEVLAKVTARLRRHSKRALPEAKTVTVLNSETSIPEPHTLLVPVHDRKDPQRLWDRTYDDADRAPDAELTAAQNRLAIPPALQADLDAQLSGIYWGAQQQS